LIQQKIENPLATLLLQSDTEDRVRIVVDFEEDEFVLLKREQQDDGNGKSAA